MKVKPLFAWYDLWIGVYVDRSERRLYLLPMPCIGLVIEWSPRQSRGDKAMCRMIGQSSHLNLKQVREMASYFKELAEDRESEAQA